MASYFWKHLSFKLSMNERWQNLITTNDGLRFEIDVLMLQYNRYSKRSGYSCSVTFRSTIRLEAWHAMKIVDDCNHRSITGRWTVWRFHSVARSPLLEFQVLQDWSEVSAWTSDGRSIFFSSCLMKHICSSCGKRNMDTVFLKIEYVFRRAAIVTSSIVVRKKSRHFSSTD